MAVTKRLRFEILRRDNHACRYCGQMAPDVKLAVDHVVPVSLGGKDEPSNLVTACSGCNAGKSSINPDQGLVDDVAQDALRFSVALRMAIAERAIARSDMQDLTDEFDDAWSGWTLTATGEPIERDNAWRSSIERFVDNGLTLEDLVGFIPKAMDARRHGEWKYLCGMAWKEITKLQDRARELASESGDEPECSKCGAELVSGCVECARMTGWFEGRAWVEGGYSLDYIKLLAGRFAIGASAA